MDTVTFDGQGGFVPIVLGEENYKLFRQRDLTPKRMRGLGSLYADIDVAAEAKDTDKMADACVNLLEKVTDIPRATLEDTRMEFLSSMIKLHLERPAEEKTDGGEGPKA